MPRPAPANAAPRPPLRLHLESSPEGLRLWLGIDGAPAEAREKALAIALQLRRALGPQRLAGIVCNGEPLHPLSPTEEP